MTLTIRTRLVVALALVAAPAFSPPAAAQPAAPPRPALTLSTPAFPDGGVIPNKYTQAADQVSPELAWTNVPAGTQSFVLHMRDPDVARNRTTEDQVHWLVWGIPGTAVGMKEGQPKGGVLPDGSRQISASGEVYRGPGAPATGPMHHYTFELFALDTRRSTCRPGLTRGPPAPPSTVPRRGTSGKAVYVGLFRRPRRSGGRASGAREGRLPDRGEPSPGCR
ncbi:MAG: YbhB/YbcL family Raf kinase inhibitor-like protein [Vicinamibacterales bacterium]